MERLFSNKKISKAKEDVKGYSSAGCSFSCISTCSYGCGGDCTVACLGGCSHGCGFGCSYTCSSTDI